MILDYELSRDRRAEAQRERSGAIQLFIRERAYCRGGIATIASQKFDGCGLGHAGIFPGVLLVQLRDRLPGDFRDGFAAGDGPREIDLDRVHKRDMVHDGANGTAVGGRDRRKPLRCRESFGVSGQAGSAFFNATRE